MVLTHEQISEIKEQLRTQVQHLPLQQKEKALQQIDLMPPESLEAFVNQQREKNHGKNSDKTVFRMIVDGEIESVKIDENSSAIAVLDITPASPGHTIVIPKNPVSDAKYLPVPAFSLAKKIARKIAGKLKSSSVSILTENKFNEVIIVLLPSYDKKISLESTRVKSSIEELEELAKKIRPIKKIPKIKINNKLRVKGPVPKLPRRIP